MAYKLDFKKLASNRLFELDKLRNENNNLCEIHNRDIDTQIDQTLSIYISRMNINTKSSTIASLFESHNIGIVDHVDLVKQKCAEPGITSAFIHFAVWFDTDESWQIQNAIRTEGYFNLNYDPSITWFVRNNDTNRKMYDYGRDGSIYEIESKITSLKSINRELVKHINHNMKKNRLGGDAANLIIV